MFVKKTNYYYNIVELQIETFKFMKYFNGLDQLSLKYDPSKNLKELPHFQCVGKSPADILDWNFTEISPIFENSVFIKLLDQIEYKTKRIRLMRMKPKSCYSLHRDTHRRLHWALITFPECHFSFQKDNPLTFNGFHIPADGFAYWTDTIEKHTAINPSEKFRYHLVIDIIE